MSRISSKVRLHKKIRIFWDRTNIINSYWFNKFLKCLMKKGKLDLTLNSILKTTKTLKKITVLPFFVFFESFTKARPAILLTMCRKGQEFHRIPFAVNKYRRARVGVKWVAMSINDRDHYPLKKLDSKINKVLTDIAVYGRGQVIKKLRVNYGVAHENRAMTHFRWEHYE